MAQTIQVYEICRACGGDGVRTSTGSQDGTPVSTSTACNACAGTGKFLNATLEFDPGNDDLMDKLNDIKEKVDEIIEMLNEA